MVALQVCGRLWSRLGPFQALSTHLATVLFYHESPQLLIVRYCVWPDSLPRSQKIQTLKFKFDQLSSEEAEIFLSFYLSTA